MQIRRVDNFPIRHYCDIFGFGKLFQADLTEMPPSEDKIFILLSHIIFARALKFNFKGLVFEKYTNTSLKLYS